MAHCRTCDVELDDKNWIPSWQASGNKQCKNCFNKINAKKNPRHNPNRMYVNGRYISKNHPLFKPGRYKTFNDAAFEGTYKLEDIKEGYVYIITNPAWPDWVKIGMAIDAEDRCNGYQTSSPFRDYVLVHSVRTANRRKAEQDAHSKAVTVASGASGEWFKMSIQDAIEIINNLKTIEEIEEEVQEEEKQPDLWTYAAKG